MLDRNEMGKENAKEVLVFDSSTFIKEVGLMSEKASALRHYLYLRGTQLTIPKVVVEECELELKNRARGKIDSINAALKWLSLFCGSVNGWTPPDDVDLEARVKALACAEAFDAVLLNESPALLQRAKERFNAERPPYHNKGSLQDCRIWEQCLELLQKHNVIFVSEDHDFCGHRQPKQLHPHLKAEADEVPGGSLTFHYGMSSLLSDLLCDEIPQLAAEKVFTFVYKSVADDVRELEANSGCRPKSSGTVEQQMFSTSRIDVVEARLNLKDSWRNAENDETMEFKLSGSCQYHLSERELCDLSVSSIGLYYIQPDGTRRAVKGSKYNMSARAYGGPPPIKPGPVALEFVEDSN